MSIHSLIFTHTHTYIYIYMSNLENPRLTERTSTNLGRSHRLPYGRLGGYRLQETAICIYIIHRNQRPIWVSLMWILEKYNAITLKRGIANLGRSNRLHSINQCPSNTYLVLPGFCGGSYIYIYIYNIIYPEKIEHQIWNSVINHVFLSFGNYYIIIYIYNIYLYLYNGDFLK